MTNLLRVHKKISTIVGKPDSNGSLEYEPEMIVPIVSNVFNISCEVIEILQSYVQRSGSRDSRELILLLQHPAFQVNPTQICVWIFSQFFRFQSLLLVHDTISQKDYVPKLPEPPFDVADEDEETIKIVQLVKSNEPLVSVEFVFTKINF